MTEPPVSEPEVLGRDGRCWFAPGHSAVHTRISFAGLALVAGGDQLFVPVTPRTARLRGLDTLQIQSREFGSLMQWVALVYLACLQARQFGNRLFDGPGFSLLLPHQAYWAELRR